MPTHSVVGFLDCTIHLTCQPSVSETLLYTGYKKCHGMKFQAIVVPDGMITHLAGPYRAPQNNAGVLVESCLLELMREHAIQPGSAEGDPLERRHFQLYSDSAYAVNAILVSPHTWVGALTVAEHAWNTGMGEVCISIEHVFGIVLQDCVMCHAGVPGSGVQVGSGRAWGSYGRGFSEQVAVLTCLLHPGFQSR